ncbi:MAG: MobA/MobL family protein [Clostridia bacterium]|nr:MobA/MobL family protein [Clostridia bacterium]
MKTYYFDASQVRRSRNESAVAFSSYMSGEKLECKRENRTYDLGHGGILYKEVMLPEGTPERFSDRGYLWNSIEKAEKQKNSSLAYRFLMGLNFPFTDKEIIDLTRKFVRENLCSRGMICDFAIHEPDEGYRTKHVHMICPQRELDSKGNWMQKNQKIELRVGENDVVKKTIDVNDWGTPRVLQDLRREWENTWNPGLREKGFEEIGSVSPKAVGFPFVKRFRESIGIRARSDRGEGTEIRDLNEWIEMLNRQNREMYLERNRLISEVKQIEEEYHGDMERYRQQIVPYLDLAEKHITGDTDDEILWLADIFWVYENNGVESAGDLDKLEELSSSLMNLRDYLEIYRSDVSKAVKERSRMIKMGKEYNDSFIEYFRDYSSLPSETKRSFYLSHYDEISKWKSAYDILREHMDRNGIFTPEALQRKNSEDKEVLAGIAKDLKCIDRQMPVLDAAIQNISELELIYGEYLREKWLQEELEDGERAMMGYFDDHYPDGRLRKHDEPEL